MAWAQHRGIDRVQVRVDDGPWRDADLVAEANIYLAPVVLPVGGDARKPHADRTSTECGGQVQTEKRTGTVPDGASGWPSVVVTID